MRAAPRTAARMSTGLGGPGSPGAQNAPQDAETARCADAAVHAPCDGPPPVPTSGAGGHHGAPARGYGPACDAPWMVRPLHMGTRTGSA